MTHSNPLRPNLRATLAGLAYAAALAAALPAAASPIEHEVNVTGATGFIRLQYGDHTLNATLASSLEVDGYTFVGRIGDQIRIQLHTLTAGIDPSLVLRDPTGTVLTTATCNGFGIDSGFVSSVCSTFLTQTLSANGTYTLNISDINANESGGYQFHIDRYPPVNNWIGLGYGSTQEAISALGHTTDIDNFAFSGVAGTGVRLTVLSTIAGLDPVLEVWGPTATARQTTTCNGFGVDSGFVASICSASMELNITTTGIYKVGLNDSGWNESGGYKLSVDCLYGDCPFAPPSPVPEPTGWAMFAAGLMALAGRLRRRHPLPH